MKTSTIVILIILVIIALTIGLTRTGVFSSEVPEEVRENLISVIDIETYEMLEVTTDDWANKFKTDPATGYKIDGQGRTLAGWITCANCGDKIPSMPNPGDFVDPDEEYAAMMRYVCPKCGNSAH